jgi:hypothetical protein
MTYRFEHCIHNYVHSCYKPHNIDAIAPNAGQHNFKSYSFTIRKARRCSGRLSKTPGQQSSVNNFPRQRLGTHVPLSRTKSSNCLSHDMSIASSKLSSPKSAILSFLLQLPVKDPKEKSNPLVIGPLANDTDRASIRVPVRSARFG